MTRLPILALATRLHFSAAHATDLAIVPDPALTPGAVRTTDPVEICEHGTRTASLVARAR
jgi:hypothetical protein